MKFSKKQGVAAFLCLLLSAGTLLTACSGQGNVQETETPTEAPTEAPTEIESETEAATEAPAEVTCTLTFADQDGTPMAALAVKLTTANGKTVDATTDEVGKCTVTLLEGKCSVSYDALPEGYLADDTAITVSKDTAEYTVKIMNNIPNGTMDRPFIIVDESTAVSIPAGTSYVYVTYGAQERSFVMSGATLTVTYMDVEYTPDAEGGIRIPLISDGPRDPAYLTLTNSTDATVEAIFTIEADPGSLNNPHVVENLGEAVTATVPKETTVYYQWTATKTGVLMVVSETEKNHITMTNMNTSVNSYYTDGSYCEYLAVTEGDVVQIAVACKDTSVDSTDIVFTLNAYAGTAEEPVPLGKDTVTLGLKAGGSCVYSYAGTATTLTVNSKGITLSCGDTIFEPDGDGVITLSLAGNGETVILTFENVTDSRTEFTLELTSPEA